MTMTSLYTSRGDDLEAQPHLFGKEPGGAEIHEMTIRPSSRASAVLAHLNAMTLTDNHRHEQNTERFGLAGKFRYNTSLTVIQKLRPTMKPGFNVQTSKDGMDGVPFFIAPYFVASQAGLFSTSLTSVVVDSKQNVKVSISSTPPPPYPSFNPSASDVRINALWFTALTFSLSAATPRDTCPEIAKAVPGLLHRSLFPFFAGLVDTTLNVNPTIWLSTAVSIGICGLLYIFTTLAPVIYPQSPYRDSVPACFIREEMPADAPFGVPMGARRLQGRRQPNDSGREQLEGVVGCTATYDTIRWIAQSDEGHGTLAINNYAGAWLRRVDVGAIKRHRDSKIPYRRRHARTRACSTFKLSRNFKLQVTDLQKRCSVIEEELATILRLSHIRQASEQLHMNGSAGDYRSSIITWTEKHKRVKWAIW
ncbi:hypothetical protein BJV77DRAFT_959642 [Russula vinacea]|nr:hypothetical protein BJV77DRAFT_959642 [Russula vinacea]